MSHNSQRATNHYFLPRERGKILRNEFLICGIIFFTGAAGKANCEVPYFFKAQNPARASEINANFRYLDSAISKNRAIQAEPLKTDSNGLLRLVGSKPELSVESQSNALRLMPSKLYWEFSNQAYSFSVAENKLQLLYAGFDGMSYSREIIQFGEFLVRNAANLQIDQNLEVIGQTSIHGKLIAFPESGFWADSTLSQSSKLTSLTEIKAYITKNGHLPNVPSAKDVEKSGLDLVEMNQILLQKVEELTLHAIAQQEQIEALKARIPAP